MLQARSLRTAKKRQLRLHANPRAARLLKARQVVTANDNLYAHLANDNLYAHLANDNLHATGKRGQQPTPKAFANFSPGLPQPWGTKYSTATTLKELAN